MEMRRTLQDALREMGFPGLVPKTPPCCGVLTESYSIVELTPDEEAEFGMAFMCAECLLSHERKVQAEQAAAELEAAGPDWSPIRGLRDVFLQRCDWTLGPDSPVPPDQQELWRDYRQQLRDITSTFALPQDVVWPEAPQHPT